MKKEDIKNQIEEKAPSRLVMIMRYAAQFLRDMKSDCVPLYAAQSVFFIIVSVVPILMIVILCFRYIPGINVTAMTSTIYRTVPAPLSTYISQIVSEVFYKAQSTAIWSLTVLTVVWSASRGTMAVYGGLNTISGGASDKSWLEMRLISFVYTVILIAVLVATVISLVFGNTLLELFDGHIAVGHYILDAIIKLKYIIFFVLLVFAFAAMYAFMPTKKLKYGTQLPGAVATAGGWLAFSFFFSIYVSNYSNYSFLYGSLAAVVLMMFWLYFCIYMLLIGAEINKHINNGFFKKVFHDIFSSGISTN